MKNTIPPIVDSLGSGWPQPVTADIVLDDTHALMTRKTFDSLPEYSGTRPTGVYAGKMWKRHDGSFDRKFLAQGGKPEWLLCWYGNSELADFCSNHSRKILLVEGAFPSDLSEAA